MIEGNLIQLCNDDGRDLDVIMMVEIEPFFNTLINKQISSATYDKLKQQLKIYNLISSLIIYK